MIAPERPALAVLADSYPSVHWDRLLFSAKESVFKSWFSMTGDRLGFDDEVEFEAEIPFFRARVLRQGSAPAARLGRQGAHSGRRPLAGVLWSRADGGLAVAGGPGDASASMCVHGLSRSAGWEEVECPGRGACRGLMACWESQQWASVSPETPWDI
ncbi:4'-phosphopantetheinyl transferase superfamily protein [Streptomyces gossypiisoli]|nr:MULTISPECIES: 4'-phosphopantetheinyl transferase superfamily protein [Streptomyces]